MQAPIRWGILGTGDIARQFAEDARHNAAGVVHAVGSRRKETAQQFAATHNIPEVRVGYEALVADPAIDAVYVASPHTQHLENTLLCLEHGKPVLCEKPMGVNAAQVQRMVSEAQKRGVFLMEAMWTWFFPAVQKAKELVAGGAIGEVRLVSASFCFSVPFDPESRLFDPAFAGGALLDVGIYPVALAQYIYGAEPEALEGMARMTPSGVDGVNGMTLRYPGGGLAVLASAVQVYQPEEAIIAGTEGYIRLPVRFYQPDSVTLVRGLHEETFHFERIGYGYHLEAAHVAECLAAGKTESPIVPHAESLRLAQTMDRLRAHWGLAYPADAT